MSATPHDDNAPVTYSLRILPRAERDRDQVVVQIAEQAGDNAAIRVANLFRSRFSVAGNKPTPLRRSR